MLPGDRVDVLDCTNGSRLTTYAVPGPRGSGDRRPGQCLLRLRSPGPRGSGEVGVNGAAAHLVSPRDVVILIAYSQLSDAEARSYVPHVVFVDERNRAVHRGGDPGAVPQEAQAARVQGLRTSGLTFEEARG